MQNEILQKKLNRLKNAHQKRLAGKDRGFYIGSGISAANEKEVQDLEQQLEGMGK